VDRNKTKCAAKLCGIQPLSYIRKTDIWISTASGVPDSLNLQWKQHK